MEMKQEAMIVALVRRALEILGSCNSQESAQTVGACAKLEMNAKLEMHALTAAVVRGARAILGLANAQNLVRTVGAYAELKRHADALASAVARGA